MIKKVDDLGRIVLPKHMRDDLEINDTVEVRIVDKEIILNNPKKDDRIERAIEIIKSELLCYDNESDEHKVGKELLSILEEEK